MSKRSALIGRRQQALGHRGERVAERYLRRNGYRILHRNLRIVDDEVDLVALDPDGTTTVIVEVKTRTTDEPAPEAAINSKQQFRLARLGSRLVKRPPFQDRPVRFDVIAIVWPDQGKPQIKHFVAAFDAPF